MSCPLCESQSEMEFVGEVMVHFNGLKNVDKAGVMLFPKFVICLDCGSAIFTVLANELALLAESTPKSSRNLAVIDATT
jgi:hypothetical protein